MIRPQLAEFMRRMDKIQSPSFPARAKPPFQRHALSLSPGLRFLLPDRL